jgi:hypothetical protein
LSQEIGALTDQLRRPSAEDIASGIAWLMDGGMQYPPSIAEDKAIDEYVLVLKDIPSCGLRKALTKLKRGQYENVTIDFIPIPAKLAALSTTEASGVIDQLSRLKEKKETLNDLAGARQAHLPRVENTAGFVPPAVAMMRKKYEGRRVLAENVEMGAFKPTEWPPGTCYVPILGKVFAPDETETKKTESPSYQRYRKSREPVRSFHEPVQNVEYWEQIQAIKDAPTITEEQHALRRKIASSVASASQYNDQQGEAAE